MAQLAGADECRAAESAVDVVHHAVSLSVQPAPGSIHGEAAIRVRARRATQLVVLDAHALGIASVRSGTHALDTRVADGHVCIKLPSPLPASAETSVDIVWDAAAHGALHIAEEEVWAGYDAAAWMPTLSDPSQRATLTLRITAPPEWRVTGSGRAAASGHVFELEQPSPSFLYAFAAGRFDEATLDEGGITLRAWGPPGADLREALTVTARSLRFFQKNIGVPIPMANYRQVFVRGDAAQEAAGFALLGASALAEVRQTPREDWIFSHELAHQWFAWLVACADFDDFWLNEGFATFMVAAAKEERWGRADYDREVALWRKRSAKVHAEAHDAPLSLAPPGAPRPRVPDSQLQARGVTYARGALVLHKLRTELGDDVFSQGVHRYVTQRAHHGATSEDLRTAFEEVSHRDLRSFFSTWVYANAPDL